MKTHFAPKREKQNQNAALLGHIVANTLTILYMIHFILTQPLTLTTISLTTLLFLFWSYFQLIPAMDGTCEQKINQKGPLNHFVYAFFICVPTAKNEVLSFYRTLARKKSFN